MIGGHQGHEEQMAICLLRALREELAPLPSHTRAMMNLRGLEKTGPEPALACGWEQRGDGAAAGPVMWSKSWEVMKLQYFGYLMRRVDSLEKTLMLGGIGGILEFQLLHQSFQ